MITLILASVAASAYCALYAAFCIKRKKAKPIAASAVMTLLPLLGVILCIIAKLRAES